jgi:hypothetical protein
MPDNVSKIFLKQTLADLVDYTAYLDYLIRKHNNKGMPWEA